MEDRRVAILLEEMRGQFKVFGELLQGTTETLNQRLDGVDKRLDGVDKPRRTHGRHQGREDATHRRRARSEWRHRETQAEDLALQ
jgi:hypothetical protein